MSDAAGDGDDAVTFDGVLEGLDAEEKKSVSFVAKELAHLTSYDTVDELKNALVTAHKRETDEWLIDGAANKIAKHIWKKLDRATESFAPASESCFVVIKCIVRLFKILFDPKTSSPPCVVAVRVFCVAAWEFAGPASAEATR